MISYAPGLVLFERVIGCWFLHCNTTFSCSESRLGIVQQEQGPNNGALLLAVMATHVVQ